jgi:CHAT domain-containing protein
LNTAVVGIVPHGQLHYLPFAALTDGKTYLGETYTLFNLPNASSLRFLHTKTISGQPTLLALGNPTTSEPLPVLNYANQEVKDIAAMFKTEALVGPQASKTTFAARAAQSTYIHLAAHGQYNPRNPLFSTIFLASSSQDDGRLEAHEIYSLDLTARTDLVVLSACQTQMGAITGGDEVVGLTRAFLYAGSPTVIASLWNVDDAATSLLMEKFYEHLLRGNSKANALRQAQADVRQKYPNPYYWAAFVLTGDPGSGKNPPGRLLGINAGNIGRIVYYSMASTVLLLALFALACIAVWWRKPNP